jgi:hypothetical protein
MTTDEKHSFSLFTTAVATLIQARTPRDGRGPMQSVTLDLLEEDVLAFHIESGLANAWPESRKKAREQIRAHRQAIVERHAKQQEQKQVPSPQPPASPQASGRLARQHVLWANIHNRPLRFDGDIESERIFLYETVAAELRAIGGCKAELGACVDHYLEFLRTNPPAFTDRDVYFAWTVDLHNAVNTRLGKPTLSLEIARRAWAL